MLKENNSGFFDNKNTSNIEMRDEIIRKSLSDALDELEKNFGDNIADWQWGNLHKVTFNHFFSGENKMVDKTINIGPFPIGGDGTTIFNTEYPFYSLKNEKQNLENKFKNVLGPSMRFIYDFSNENECLFILPTGESGHPLSPHYKDMTNLWFNGKYIKVYQNEDNIKKISKDVIVIRNN
jgi:penicillin amidase